MPFETPPPPDDKTSEKPGENVNPDEPKEIKKNIEPGEEKKLDENAPGEDPVETARRLAF